MPPLEDESGGERELPATTDATSADGTAPGETSAAADGNATQPECGDGATCHRLGQARMTEGDPTAARPLFAAACEQQHALSCGTLGLLLVRGEGGPADPGRGARLAERSCEGGFIRGCTYFAMLLKEGRGVPVDLPRARSLHGRACDASVPESCFNLAAMLERGAGGARDRAQARTMFQRACTLGWRPACEIVAEGARAPETGGPAAADATPAGPRWMMTFTDLEIDGHRFGHVGSMCNPLVITAILTTVGERVARCTNLTGTHVAVTVDGGRVTESTVEGPAARCVRRAVRGARFASLACRFEADLLD